MELIRGRGGSASGSSRRRGSRRQAWYSRDDHTGPVRPGGTTGPGATFPAVAATPVPAAAPPAPVGMPPEQMYRLVCMACHGTDGKGKIVRLAMPSIPDLTDVKWQASRKDSELQHSILEGKDSIVNGVKLPLMLPMKNKLALAHTDVKDMVAFMRGFKDGKQVVSATPGGMPAAGVPGPGCPRDQTQGVPPRPSTAPPVRRQISAN